MLLFLYFYSYLIIICFRVRGNYFILFLTFITFYIVKYYAFLQKVLVIYFISKSNAKIIYNQDIMSFNAGLERSCFL